MIAADQREAKRVYRAAWYQDHREELLTRQAAYYEAHREEVLFRVAAWYQDNRDAVREKKRKDKAEFLEWLQILRTNNGCEDCDTHDGGLEHHHVDPSTKRYKVSAMYGFSLDTLEDELEKCVVLCRPCHNKRHEEMRDFS